jgi:hypothetical protein
MVSMLSGHMPLRKQLDKIQREFLKNWMLSETFVQTMLARMLQISFSVV